MFAGVRAKLVQNKTQVERSLRLELNLRSDARDAVVRVTHVDRQLIFNKRRKVGALPA